MLPPLLALSACALLNADEEQVRERRKQADPRASRLGIAKKRKRRRDGTFKDLVYQEWLEQATSDMTSRPDVVLCNSDTIEIVDLTSDSDDDAMVE